MTVRVGSALDATYRAAVFATSPRSCSWPCCGRSDSETRAFLLAEYVVQRGAGLCAPVAHCLRPFVRVGGVPREMEHALTAVASTLPKADVRAGELRLSREESLHDLSGHVVAPILAT
jgi:hypothetical protein